MNLKEIKDLIELVSERGFAEFEIERQGFRLRISRFKEAPASVVAPVATPLIVSSPISTSSQVSPAQAPDRKLLTSEPIDPSPAASNAQPEKTAEPPAAEHLHTIKSPIVGTFYRAPSQESEPFVKIGDHVDSDTVVCIVEAMKLMNEIQAEVSGQVVKIFVENKQPVEYGQPLFGIRV
ncbi:MAG TPA: acetyl-CoA carboxylase biotin carboxyl carrier protein [Blastocatellia bacterium]|nr:acetyl-CoA carboxylase biotin carboxyl carrier protein [Blastocatellia bacterium]